MRSQKQRQNKQTQNNNKKNNTQRKAPASKRTKNIILFAKPFLSLSLSRIHRKQTFNKTTTTASKQEKQYKHKQKIKESIL